MRLAAVLVFAAICSPLVGCRGTTTTAVAPTNLNAAGSGDKLVGKWRVVKDKGEPLPNEVEIFIEFLGEGKMKMLDKDGTYKVTGDKLTITTKTPIGKDDPKELAIKTLKDDTLILMDEMSKEMELKQQK